MKNWKRNLVLGALCCSLAAFAALPAGAETLVMKDGSRVETRGAFEVKGRRVVFHDGQGKLVALRLDEVDLGASEAANRPAPPPGQAAANAASPALKKAPVLVLTDRDVAHVDPSELATAAPIAPRVVLYSTSWCGYCRKMRALLGELAIDFTELDIEKSEAARSAKNQLDASCGVPVVDFGGQVICGFAEARVRSLAKEAAKQAAKAEKLAEAETAAGGEL